MIAVDPGARPRAGDGCRRGSVGSGVGLRLGAMVCGVPKARFRDGRPSSSTLGFLVLIALLAANPPGCRASAPTDPASDEAFEDEEPIPPGAAGVRDHALNPSILGL